MINLYFKFLRSKKMPMLLKLNIVLMRLNFNHMITFGLISGLMFVLITQVILQVPLTIWDIITFISYMFMLDHTLYFLGIRSYFKTFSGDEFLLMIKSGDYSPKEGK